MKLRAHAMLLSPEEKTSILSQLGDLGITPFTTGSSVVIDYEGDISDKFIEILEAIEALPNHEVQLVSVPAGVNLLHEL